MSQRTLDSDLETSATSTAFHYAVFVSLAFPSGTVRVHNSVGTLSFGGNDYLGVGAFGSVDAMMDSDELVDQPVKLVLSSITPEIITAMQTDDIYGRSADIYLGALNEDGALVGTPTNWITGYMEGASLTVGNENAVMISVQTAAAKLRRRNNKRFTLEHHQQMYPADEALEFLPYVVEANVQWGGDKVRTGFTNDGDNIGGSGTQGGSGTGRGRGRRG